MVPPTQKLGDRSPPVPIVVAPMTVTPKQQQQQNNAIKYTISLSGLCDKAQNFVLQTEPGDLSTSLLVSLDSEIRRTLFFSTIPSYDNFKFLTMHSWIADFAPGC